MHWKVRGLCTLQAGGVSETWQVEYTGADMFDRLTKAREQSWGKKLALVDATSEGHTREVAAGDRSGVWGN